MGVNVSVTLVFGVEVGGIVSTGVGEKHPTRLAKNKRRNPKSKQNVDLILFNISPYLC
jgi:hypothetical protein